MIGFAINSQLTRSLGRVSSCEGHAAPYGPGRQQPSRRRDVSKCNVGGPKFSEGLISRTFCLDRAFDSRSRFW